MQVISQKNAPTNIELIIDPLNQTKIKKKIKNHSIYPPNGLNEAFML